MACAARIGGLMLPPTPLLLLGALVSAGHAAALVGGRLGWPAAPLRTRAIPATLLMDGDDDEPGERAESTPDELDAFRAQLMRQFETAGASTGADTAGALPSESPAPQVGRRHRTSQPVLPRGGCAVAVARWRAGAPGLVARGRYAPSCQPNALLLAQSFLAAGEGLGPVRSARAHSGRVAPGRHEGAAAAGAREWRLGSAPARDPRGGGQPNGGRL